jgi:uncharacterized protein (DUF1697 family)
MPVFRSLLAGLGHGDVSTFIASGNAVFTSDRDDVTAMEREIEAAIKEETGVNTAAFLRTAAEMREIVDGNPFDETAGLHVAFLGEQPEEKRLADLQSMAFEGERLDPGDRVLYLVYHNGTARSKLTNTLIEGRLGVQATARNWNTVTRLVALSCS